MLSYRHAYHAGNFADVFKHIVLTLLLNALRQKEKPFLYLDTHSGAGRYDLNAEFAQKNSEYLAGISRLYQETDWPAAASTYLQLVHQCNANLDTIQYYPGSPWLALHLMRPQDRLYLCELHPRDVEILSKDFGQQRRVTVEKINGYQRLISLLPPLERRGLAFIDPAFERKHEIDELIEALTQAWRRWPTGMYGIWYPLHEHFPLQSFRQRLIDTGQRKLLVAEFLQRPAGGLPGMYGSGLVIVNPPWTLTQQLDTIKPWLERVVGEKNQGSLSYFWLVPE